MAFVIAVEEFFGELPGIVEAATRHVYSSNIGVLEYHGRKLQDALNVTSVFLRRCEETAAPEDFKFAIRRIITEMRALCARIEDVILTDEDYVLELHQPNPEVEVDIDTGVPGRPRILIEEREIQSLYSIYRSWAKVSEILGISERTLYRRRNALGLPVSERKGPRKTYTEISDRDLANVVREVLDVMPEVGESYVIGACRRRNINVQRERIREAISTVDPVGRALRRSMTILRRTYSVPAPNSLW
eukprot:gene10335-11410_t